MSHAPQKPTPPGPLTQVTLGPGVPAETEQILRSLPAWFGDEAALQRYVHDAPRRETFTARRKHQAVGLLSFERLDAVTAEIHLMAVRAPHRGTGVGTRLLKTAQDHLRATGVRHLRVKTLSGRSPDPHYAQTRGFYAARNFRPVAELPEEWGPRHPCLLMQAALTPG